MRGIAAIVVLLTHTYLYIYSVQSGSLTEIMEDGFFHQYRYIGAIGVDIFFVISGFIMYRISDSTKHNLTSYSFLKSRFMRIFPIYWVVLAVYILMALSIDKSFLISDILKSAFLYPVFIDSDIDMVLGVAWTLSYEILFYFIIAFLIAINKITILSIFISLALVFVLSNLFLSGDAKLFFGNTILFEFFLGAFVYWLNKNFNYNFKVILILCTLFIFTFIFSIENYNGFHLKFDELRFLYLGIPSFLIILSAVQLDKKNSITSKRAKLYSYLGDISYPLYLIHFSIIIPVLGKVFSYIGLWAILPVNISFSLIVAAVIISSILFRHLIEAPLMRSLKRYG